MPGDPAIRNQLGRMEMVCGQRPFKGEDTPATLRQILHSEPPPLPETAPETVKALIGKCLRKSRQESFQTRC